MRRWNRYDGCWFAAFTDTLYTAYAPDRLAMQADAVVQAAHHESMSYVLGPALRELIFEFAFSRGPCLHYLPAPRAPFVRGALARGQGRFQLPYGKSPLHGSSY